MFHGEQPYLLARFDSTDSPESAMTNRAHTAYEADQPSSPSKRGMLIPQGWLLLVCTLLLLVLPALHFTGSDQEADKAELEQIEQYPASFNAAESA